MLVLGLETSCDETSAALVRDGSEVLTNVVASQVDLHGAYGGVVPEIAARAHVEALIPVLSEALDGSPGPVDLVAVTAGPGLVGSLVVGVAGAKALAWAWEVPLVAVNHLEAHIFAPMCEGTLPEVPFLACVVSGGHTLLAEVRGVDDMEVLGRTLDDALGEAYDKVAKFLGLGYPGGPIIDEMSAGGDPRAVAFPRAMISSGDLNFSLSGLKTAVIRYVAKVKESGGSLPPTEDIVASFQAAALEVVVRKTVLATRERGLGSVVLGGGVACNRSLRRMMEEAGREEGLEVVFPSAVLCTDNAAMVAASGYLKHGAGFCAGLELEAEPSLTPGGCIPGEGRF